MKNTALALALALALAFPLVSCSKGAPPAPPATLPEFTLENVAGGVTKTADLKGKVLVVDFWATWCEPCLSEIPKFNKMTDEFKGRDVEIVGITVESPKEEIKPKVKETGMKYTVLVGTDAVVDGFGGIIGWPTTFVVTKDWKIYKKYVGALPDKEQRIKKDIEKLLADNNAD